MFNFWKAQYLGDSIHIRKFQSFLISISRLMLLVILFSPNILLAHFPQSFKWCSATAAHQVEGENIHSDWWTFEQMPGAIKNNDKSGLAVNQWNLFPEDIKRMKALGLNSYRFSVEWAKIEPKENSWDEKALDHYRQMVKQLRLAGIEPLVTLHHFTLPQWFAAKGGWSSQESVPLFVRYATRVFEALHQDVDTWVTFNEPMVVITVGYLDGLFPPLKKNDAKGALMALKNILQSHAEAVLKMRGIDLQKKARFGFAHHLRVFDPENKFNPLDYIVRNQLDQIWNWSFPMALSTGRFKLSIPFQASIDEEIPHLKGTQDFFGINYYTRDLVGFSLSAPYFKRSTVNGASVSDLGWEIYPQGLERLLIDIHEKFPNLNILITENGIADATDLKRTAFIEEHLRIVEKAIASGIPVEGYCHWSLLDNFEWAEGFTPRFGLYEVVYPSLVRIQRKSSLRLKTIIENRTTNAR